LGDEKVYIEMEKNWSEEGKYLESKMEKVYRKKENHLYSF
jgi:predicted nuclease of restriction endonuclease-like RecB superfamily